MRMAEAEVSFLARPRRSSWCRPCRGTRDRPWVSPLGSRWWRSPPASGSSSPAPRRSVAARSPSGSSRHEHPSFQSFHSTSTGHRRIVRRPTRLQSRRLELAVHTDKQSPCPAPACSSLLAGSARRGRRSC